MSLNKALTELFKAVREEAQVNPAFARKLEDALIQFKPSRRRLRRPPAHEPVMAIAAALAEAPGRTEPAAPAPVVTEEPAPQAEPAAKPEPAIKVELNPIALFSRDGESALREALENESYSREALAAIVEEHNLDPAGIVADGDKPALVEQIVVQARKRVERDKRIFDY